MGDLREEQLITTYGPGSILDLVDYPVLIKSSVYWLTDNPGEEPVSSQSLKIQDLAIQDLIEKKLIELTKGRSYPIKQIKGLMKPPPEANELNKYFGRLGNTVIDAQRFPQYHRCLRCNHFCKLDEDDMSTMCAKCGGKLEATRWILMCRNGHIHDFNWHQAMFDTGCNCNPDNSGNEESNLTYKDSGENGTFADIKISCKKCKVSSNLGFLKSKLDGDDGKCNGKMLWFKDTKENCGEKLQLTLRGQSNVYVSETINKISLPKDEGFSKLNIDHSLFFASYKNPPEGVEPKVAVKLGLRPIGYDDIDIDGYCQWLDMHDDSSDFLTKNQNYQDQEFELLSASETKNDSEFNSAQIDISSNGFISSHFKSINKISRIKIVKALLGFRRAFDQTKQFQAVTKDNEYIPAVETYGEGIFFKLDNNILNKWVEINNNGVDKYKLLHSLSHFLMHEFAYVSGFSITELKEIIYFQDEGKDTGILIYTSSGDSQCSMGGLADLADAKKI